MTAQNIGNYLISSYSLYPYLYPLAGDSLSIELDMIGRTTARLGIEIDQVKYNTGFLRILWDFASNRIDTNVGRYSSQVSSDKGVINLANDIVEKYWQTTGCAYEYFEFDVGSGKIAALDTIGFIDTNISTGAVITIKGYGTSGSVKPVSWTNIPVLATIPSKPDELEKNIIYIAQSLPEQYRHYRVEIRDPLNADGFLRVGRVAAGSALIFVDENCLDHIQSIKQNYKDELQLNGFTSIANNRALKKNMTLTFRNLNRVQRSNYNKLMTYINYCRDTLKALVVVDPQDPYLFTVFSKLKNMPQETHNYISSDTSYVELGLTYDEAR